MKIECLLKIVTKTKTNHYYLIQIHGLLGRIIIRICIYKLVVFGVMSLCSSYFGQSVKNLEPLMFRTALVIALLRMQYCPLLFDLIFAPDSGLLLFYRFLF